MIRFVLPLILLLLSSAVALAQTPYYQGKTITFIVGSGAGTAYDMYSRLLANHIGKHIAGNPAVVMQNMPAAGGIVAANFVYGVAKPDGLTLASINPAHYFNQLQGNKEIKFDWPKFSWLASSDKSEHMLYMRTDAPFKSMQDVRKATEAPKCGATGTGTSGHYMPPALVLPEVTDLSKWWKGKHRYVDPEGQYVFVYQSTLYGPPFYTNTKLVNLESIRSVWDLLDPKWKGKTIALWPRANYVSTALLFMYHHPQVGPKFLERLYGGEMDLTYFSDFRQGTDWLASGKYQICVLCRLRRAMSRADIRCTVTIRSAIGFRSATASDIRHRTDWANKNSCLSPSVRSKSLKR